MTRDAGDLKDGEGAQDKDLGEDVGDHAQVDGALAFEDRPLLDDLVGRPEGARLGQRQSEHSDQRGSVSSGV